MRMARVNVYVPDDLAEEARAAGLNVSQLTQKAMRDALDARRAEGWFDQLARLRRTGIDHHTAVRALDAARHELDAGA